MISPYIRVLCVSIYISLQSSFISMSSHNITMGTINFALFFITLSTLLSAHHALQLNDVRFGRRPPLQATPEVIQMVTGKEELQSQPSYGRDKPKAPPSPELAPPRNQAAYGRVNPILAPPSPKVAPSHDHATYFKSRGQAAYFKSRYGGNNQKLAPPSPESVDLDQGQTDNGRDKQKTPPPPKVAPSRGEATYGGDNPHIRHNLFGDGHIYVRFGRRPPLQAAPEEIQMVIGEEKLQSPPSYGRDKPKTPSSPRVAPSGGQKTYGGDYPNLSPPSPESAYGREETKSPPSPEKSPSRGQKTYGEDNQNLAPLLPEYGRDNTKAPPSPEVAPPRGQTIFGGDNRKSNGQTKYGREDPKTPPTPDPSDGRIQFVDGRVDPTVNSLSQLARF